MSRSHLRGVLCSRFFLIFYSPSRLPPAFLACRRRFLGVSVAGNRRDRFFCSSNRRATSLSISSPHPFISFFPFFFYSSFAFGPLQTIGRDPRRETGNDRLNSVIIAGDFASTSQTQTVPRPGGCILISRLSETRLLIRSADFPDVYCFRTDILFVALPFLHLPLHGFPHH